MMNKEKLELYIHIPFCIRKCAYCDFLSFQADAQICKDYVDKLIEEIGFQSAGCREYCVTTIFIGGGTPSILNEKQITAILDAVRDGFCLEEEAEITIEANPGTLTMEKLKAYRLAGINRISLGLQSADDKELKALGRIHTFDDFLKSYQNVRMSGFQNVNVDLMSALPGQTIESWKNTLRKVTMLKPEHISAYSLIIEEGTPFYERYGKNSPLVGPVRLELPDEDTEREMYYLTNTFLKEQGYKRYEISNYSRPGHECRHNIGYWTGVWYLGLGLGASSHIRGCRFHNESDMAAYLSTAMGDTLLCQGKEVLNSQSKMEEFMFLGLRLMEGVSQQDFVAATGHNIWDIYGEVIRKFETEGLLEEKGGFIHLTERGIDVSNYVMSEFLL